MLFTTAVFVLLFLPVVWTGFFLLGSRSPGWGAAWLFAASVFFYGWWMPEFTLLLLASIGFNFVVGRQVAAAATGATRSALSASTAWLVLGIVVDLSLLAYFKYANFFLANVNSLIGAHRELAHIVLPIGISFYTFTQIAFLVDCRRHGLTEYRLLHYGLFVTYFPHLIAGPILHHGQMMPQFANPAVYKPHAAHVAGGLAIFAIGLFKKVVLADGVAAYADAVFRPADAGLTPDAIEAWLGAVAYSLQLYFDFSGYSDMAIGLSWMFNIRLPFNFDSPYRATSISDFWRRWHISLSNFLRDYLYIALGGNRHGSVRRYLNLTVTMILGGLWHGASWSFVLWGALHGAYLMVNHAFRAACSAAQRDRMDRSRVFGVFGWSLTMLAVVLAWVFFRAETLPGALRMLQGMAGLATASADVHPLLWNAGLHSRVGWWWCGALGLVACAMPNSNRIGLWLSSRAKRLEHAALIGAVSVCLILFFVLINTARDSVSAFIYFNF